MWGTTTPTSRLHTGGSFATAIMTTASNLILNKNHHTIILGGNHNIVLPAANTCTGRVYIIKNPSAPATTISVFKNNSGSDDTLVPANSSLWLQSDGSNWQQIN